MISQCPRRKNCLEVLEFVKVVEVGINLSWFSLRSAELHCGIVVTMIGHLGQNTWQKWLLGYLLTRSVQCVAF